MGVLMTVNMRKHAQRRCERRASELLEYALPLKARPFDIELGGRLALMFVAP